MLSTFYEVVRSLNFKRTLTLTVKVWVSGSSFEKERWNSPKSFSRYAKEILQKEMLPHVGVSDFCETKKAVCLILGENRV